MISLLSVLNKNKHILVTQSLVLKVVFERNQTLQIVKHLAKALKQSNSEIFLVAGDKQILEFYIYKTTYMYVYIYIERDRWIWTSFHFLLCQITFPSQFTHPPNPLQRGFILNVYFQCYSNKLTTNRHFQHLFMAASRLLGFFET